MVIEMCQYHYPYYTRTCADRYVYHCVCRFRTEKYYCFLFKRNTDTPHTRIMTAKTHREIKRHFVVAIVVDALIFLEARPNVFTMEMFVHKSSMFSCHKHSRVRDYFSFLCSMNAYANPNCYAVAVHTAHYNCRYATLSTIVSVYVLNMTTKSLFTYPRRPNDRLLSLFRRSLCVNAAFN